MGMWQPNDGGVTIKWSGYDKHTMGILQPNDEDMTTRL